MVQDDIDDEYTINVVYPDRIDKYQRVVAASGVIWSKQDDRFKKQSGVWKELQDGDNERMEAAYQSGIARGKRH